MTTQKERWRGATPCYGCLCDTCANSVELLPCYTTIGEAEEPCFSCDDCRHFGGDIRKADQWHGDCPRHIGAKKVEEARRAEKERLAELFNKRAEAARAKFRVIKGGGQ